MVHMSLGVVSVASLGKSFSLFARVLPWLFLVLVLVFLTMLFRLFMRLFVLMLLRVVGLFWLLSLWILVAWLLGLLRLVRLLGLLSLLTISVNFLVLILLDIAPLVISGLAPGILNLLLFW